MNLFIVSPSLLSRVCYQCLHLLRFPARRMVFQVFHGAGGEALVSVLATALFCIALGGVYGPAHFVPIYKTSHIEEDRHTGLAV